MTGTGSWGLKAIVIEVTFFEHPPIASADREMTQEYSTCLEQSNGVTAEMINCILAESKRQRCSAQ